MKAQFVYERLEFDRGNNPLDSLNIGNKGVRIYNKLSNIAQVLDIEEVGVEDLNKEKAIASWRIPGIKGKIERVGYGRIILYLSDIGGEKEYQVYAKGKRGSDIQSWEAWDSIDKWRDNLHQLNESVNFERGKDPKETMGLGKARLRDFNSLEEAAKWVVLFPNIVTEGKFQSWEGLTMPYDADRKIGTFKEEIIPYFDKLDLVRWIKNNLLVNGTPLVLRDSKEIADQATYMMLGLEESLGFEREKDPKQSLDIGLDRKISKGDIFNAIFRFKDYTEYNILKISEVSVKVKAIQDEEIDEDSLERITVGRIIGHEEKGDWVCIWDDNLKKWIIE